MKLAQWQQAFHTWLVSASDDSARLLGDRHAGLAVYQNNYRAQLVGCLEQAFPIVRRWLGEEAFLAASITHIDQQPRMPDPGCVSRRVLRDLEDRIAE